MKKDEVISGDQSNIPEVLAHAKQSYLQIIDGKLDIYKEQLERIELKWEHQQDLKARITKLTEIRKGLAAAQGKDIYNYPEILTL